MGDRFATTDMGRGLQTQACLRPFNNRMFTMHTLAHGVALVQI